MLDRLGDVYAKAILLGLTDKKEQEAIYLDMLNLAETFSDSFELRNFIFRTNLKVEQTADVLARVFDFAEPTKRVMNYIIVKRRRLLSLEKICKSYIFFYEEKNNIKNITIITAQEVKEKQEKEMKKYLEDYFQTKEIRISKRVDEEIIGGIKFIVDDVVYDNSIRNYLNRIIKSVNT